MKDYFWINDMFPRIIMHPYRPDLEGNDISHYADPNGKLLFVEFVETVKSQGEGYVDYKWQWKDDPAELSQKSLMSRAFRHGDGLSAPEFILRMFARKAS
jgi:signal transduction histidine kinase